MGQVGADDPGVRLEERGAVEARELVSSKRAPHASSAARELSTPGGASSTSPFSSSSVSPLSASSARQPASDSCASLTHSACG